MKLELKDISGYLPYGLQFMLTCDWREDINCDEIGIPENILERGQVWDWVATITNTDIGIPLYGDGELSKLTLAKDGCWISISNGAKPILFPLDCLTKPIEVNGEEFVPADRLDLLTCGELLLKTSIYREPECLVMDGQPYNVIKFFQNNMIDYQDLIGKGLAVSVFDLPENPYR